MKYSNGFGKGAPLIGMAIVALAIFFPGLCGQGLSQTAPPPLPPGVQDVLKLAHAGMSDDLIMAQVRSAAATYNLSADQILYLSSQGVSQNVIKALISGASAPAAPAPVTPPPAPPISAGPSSPAPPTAPPAGSPGVNYDSFHGQLAPFGSWVDVAGYGSCWRPTVAAEDPEWRPYADAGHWIYTDSGWFWQSDYAWGDVAFHYGRWLRSSIGWVWVPGYDWAPAWVCWRRTDRYCGWAPLPPAAVFKPELGLTFDGQVAVDTDFGLGPEAFVFVGYDHFWDLNLRGYFLARGRIDPIFRASFVINGYRLDHGRFIIDGLGRDVVATMTHHEVRIEAPFFHDDRFRPGDDRLFGPDHHDDRRFDDRRPDDRRPGDHRFGP